MAVIAVVREAAADGASCGLVIQIYKPGPELYSLLGTLILSHHNVLQEDGQVAVPPSDAGVVTC